jgi:hypothetical protein
MTPTQFLPDFGDDVHTGILSASSAQMRRRPLAGVELAGSSPVEGPFGPDASDIVQKLRVQLLKLLHQAYIQLRRPNTSKHKIVSETGDTFYDWLLVSVSEQGT